MQVYPRQIVVLPSVLLIQCVALQILADVKFAYEYDIQNQMKRRDMN